MQWLSEDQLTTAFFVLLGLVVIVLLIRWTTPRSQKVNRNTAEEKLEARHEHGEIADDEYEEIKRDLGGM